MSSNNPVPEVIDFTIWTITCIHVLEQGAKPEYHKSDDCYVCSGCRDYHAEYGFTEEAQSKLKPIHKDCLLQLGIIPI